MCVRVTIFIQKKKKRTQEPERQHGAANVNMKARQILDLYPSNLQMPVKGIFWAPKRGHPGKKGRMATVVHI